MSSAIYEPKNKRNQYFTILIGIGIIAGIQVFHSHDHEHDHEYEHDHEHLSIDLSVKIHDKS